MNQIICKLKGALLKRGIVEENHFLDLYLQLLEDNLRNERGERHHVIPVASYSEEGVIVKEKYLTVAIYKARLKLANADHENRVVKLPREVHRLAHAYLYMAGWHRDFSSEEVALEVIKNKGRLKGKVKTEPVHPGPVKRPLNKKKIKKGTN